MRQTTTIKEKFNQFLIVLVPILVTQLGMFSMSFFDTMMSGKFSSVDLAGVAIGSSLWVPIFTGLSGILLAVTPIVAQLVGGGRQKEIAFSVIQGIYAAAVLALVVIIAGFVFLDPILNNMNLEEGVRTVARQYLIALAFGVIPVFIYNVLRSFIDALGMTTVTMYVTLTSLPINIFFNYVLIFGKFGFPEMGGVGAGIASSITYWLITLIAWFVIARYYPLRKYNIFGKWFAISLSKWKEILLIGIPIGLSIFFEVSIFSAVTLFMSEYSTNVIAAHTAAINFASFLYMIPLSISMGLTIVVGFEVGAKRLDDAKTYSLMGIFTAIILAIIYGIILLLFREPISILYTDNPEVSALIVNFLLYAVLFQLSDAIQAPVQGALRGYKDVNITFIMALISYWVLGLPLGYILAKFTEFGPYGYWIGLISGLTAGAITLSWRLVIVQKKTKMKIRKT
ncbi:MATE family efflux transporter [Rossellomorea vietnamensis]|uniref:Probable multidrug resistance protein NorM n=1 Tax=Rossellomorea vietnamensis TaxID=218284 RepID=A0A5D4KH28_9BACI|nr:MATE family efflux transporter [Rossellomorea vietnamensis]TYR76594.1 MATE family efflux transporter [Rossellomorea vietnamensis]